MTLWRFLFRLIRFRPWYFFINTGSITLLLLVNMAPGLVTRTFFNELSAHTAAGANLWSLLAILFATSLATTVFLVGCQVTNAPFMLINAALLQKNLMARILDLPGAKALQEAPGEILSRFRDDVDDVTGVLIDFNDMVAIATFAIVAFAIMFSIDATLTITVMAPLAIVVGVVQLAGRRVVRFRTASREATASVTRFLGEVFGGVQAVQVAGAEEAVRERFAVLSSHRLRMTVRERAFDQTLQSTFWNAVNVGTGFILLVAGQRMRAGTFPVGDFALFVFYLGWIAETSTVVGRFLTRYRRCHVSLTRMLALLGGAEPNTLVRYGPVYESGAFPAIPVIAKQPTDRLEQLTVRHLSYRFDNEHPGLSNISFALQRGSFTVITGRIGAGKTTLLRSLLGLLPLQEGEILWNEQRVEQPADWFVPLRCAYTPQAPRLFSESLRENILLGQPEEPGALARALELAVLDDDIRQLDQGLDTLVGPKGVRLSGGQVQRAAAARMFIHDAELFIFDDLSSALDVQTERALWQRLAAHSAATVLAVSHRQAALRRADQIILMADGAISDIGTLPELLERSAEMRHLWRDELSPEELAIIA